MYTLDDPMLALILRFVGRSQEITLGDDDFLQEQLKAIREHIRDSPPEDHQALALEWVENHARDYRDRWARAIVEELFAGERCGDCPLAGTDFVGTCQIHEEWLGLLQRYVADEISPSAYAESSLALLARHKEDLKVNPAPAQEMA